MTWTTLHSVQVATRCEFTAQLAAQHCFVRLPSGRWSRVLGTPPANAVRIRGRVWRIP